MEKPLNLTPEELAELLEDSPLLKAELERIVRGNKELTDPRVKSPSHKPFIDRRIEICGLCESVKEDNTLMEYRQELLSFIRIRTATREELESLEIRNNGIMVLSFKCPSCPSKLLSLEKEELVEKLLRTTVEKEVNNRKLKNEYILKTQGRNRNDKDI